MKFTTTNTLLSALSLLLLPASSLSLSLSPSDLLARTSTGTQYLQATSIVTKNGNSAFECWRLSNPFVTSTAAGTSGASSLFIDNLANVTYTVLPERFEGGVHNAPHPQLVIFLSGLAHITLPHAPQSVWAFGGAEGLIFAVDTTGTGHNTSYPGPIPTVALQIPLAGGVLPPYSVVHEGPCRNVKEIVTA
ncbi:hypothetical protein BDW22DRAFT_1362300 [Trametopsis cervina]|nr:hypothetical protein BDW22DRAFT_1362300 [Trametopsis cervina]